MSDWLEVALAAAEADVQERLEVVTGRGDLVAEFDTSPLPVRRVNPVNDLAVFMEAWSADVVLDDGTVLHCEAGSFDVVVGGQHFLVHPDGTWEQVG